MTAAHSTAHEGKTTFVSTRFGNVLGSRGSVIPIFREQIRQGGPVTLTNSDMTRFIMSIKEAARLVIDSAMYANGGEVMITKMPVIRIQDLAEVMIRELAPSYGFDPLNIEVKIIGTKPGEKLYEELMSVEETRRAWELSRYFVVLPAFANLYKRVNFSYSDLISKEVSNPYHSGNESYLSQDDLAWFLQKNNLLKEGSV